MQVDHVHYERKLSDGKSISLTQGKIALVDEEDYERLMRYKWSYHKAWKTSRELGYAVTNMYDATGVRKMVQMHRFIMNAEEGVGIDHGDGDGLNNRKSNLERISNSGNTQRQHTMRGASRFQGVTWYMKQSKWGARIECGDTRYFLGLFEDEHDAALAYDEAAVEHFGPRAKRNLPAGSTYRQFVPQKGVVVERTHCRRGHPWTETNVYVRPDGDRICRRCQCINHQTYKARHRAMVAATEG